MLYLAGMRAEARALLYGGPLDELESMIDWLVETGRPVSSPRGVPSAEEGRSYTVG